MTGQWASDYIPTTFTDPPRWPRPPDEPRAMLCGCGGGIETAVVMVGPIAAYGACVLCGAGFLVSRRDGVTTVEKHP